ncbi:hypothetical protein [Pararhodobacter marinus]|uniref:hypothetical protein n=2 Tax=Pararhodobacter marinus TaxID=2184063 RepID=UPI0035110EB3
MQCVGGRWTASLGQRMIPVPAVPGARLVCADAGDLGRALAGLQGGSGRPDPDALYRAYADEKPLLARIRAREGVADPCAAPERSPLQQPRGPALLLSAASFPLSRIMRLLVALAPGGVVWKPAPGAAASAHLLMRVLVPHAGGRLALLQGDHATGGLLAKTMTEGQGTLIWASDAAPPDGMDACTRVSARGPAIDPRRR